MDANAKFPARSVWAVATTLPEFSMVTTASAIGSPLDLTTRPATLTFLATEAAENRTPVTTSAMEISALFILCGGGADHDQGDGGVADLGLHHPVVALL